MSGDKRDDELRQLLTQLRDSLYERVRGLRQDQEGDALTDPGDVADVANSLQELETHANLIQHAEDQLVAIDSAFARLDAGQYGICANCGEEIPTARLRVLPFTIYCVDCKSEAVQANESGLSRTERQSYRRWTPPPEADENQMLADNGGNSVDELSVRSIGPEEAEEAEEVTGSHEKESD
jgi:DnaK suppressor protein